MARITLGIGTSHSPILVLDGDRWEQRAQDDRRQTALYTLDGRKCSYDQLLAERGEPFREQSDAARFPDLARQAEAALDVLEARLFDAQPDVVLVIGDDQDELFGFDNMPAISVYRGPEVVMKEMPLPHPRLSWADKAFWAGYGMDMPRRFPGAPQLADDLIRGLIRLGVDVATANAVPNPGQRAFGHAYGINTYFPPNNPTAARCFEFGSHIAHALAASPIDAKVAVIASGGLSHFLCEEAFDRKLLQAIRTHDVQTLTQVTQESLCSGSSEIRNWIAMAGATSHLQCRYEEYIPVYRTAVGTGIGLAFTAWD
jgi:hypothetical protein